MWFREMCTSFGPTLVPMLNLIHVYTWAAHVTLLGLSLFIYKMGLVPHCKWLYGPGTVNVKCGCYVMITDLYLLKEENKRLLSSFEKIVAHFLHRFFASYQILVFFLRKLALKRKLFSPPSPLRVHAPMPQDL